MLTLLKTAILALTFLSLFGTYYEYDNYSRQSSTAQFLYEEGANEPATRQEQYEGKKASYDIVKNRFGQLLVLNLTIVALVVLHQLLARKRRADEASRRWASPPPIPILP